MGVSPAIFKTLALSDREGKKRYEFYYPLRLWYNTSPLIWRYFYLN